MVFFAGKSQKETSFYVDRDNLFIRKERLVFKTSLLTVHYCLLLGSRYIYLVKSRCYLVSYLCDFQKLFMNIGIFLLLIFSSISYGIFNNGVKYVPMGYKEKVSCPPNVPTKKQGGGNVTFL